MQVEFAGGALRCGEYIMVRKVGDSILKVASASFSSNTPVRVLAELYMLQFKNYGSELVMLHAYGCLSFL